MLNTVKKIIVDKLQDYGDNQLELIDYHPRDIHINQEVYFRYQGKFVNVIVRELGITSSVEVLSR